MTKGSVLAKKPCKLGQKEMGVFPFVLILKQHESPIHFSGEVSQRGFSPEKYINHRAQPFSAYLKTRQSF